MNAGSGVAIVGIACRYPDADNVQQLWENIVTGRRAFRNMPVNRLGRSYFSPDNSSADQIYTNKAAVLKNYQFNRLHYNISGASFNTADMTHWLALDVAHEAIKDAGLENIDAGIKEKTGVIIGNTLTGEFSRAGMLRLRWPFVANSITTSLKQQGWHDNEITKLLRSVEQNFKQPFPAMEEDSLAGSLSNTISGRICNYFDFKGGGFTIDGACSSSLLAVAKACDAITNKELLIAITGGVDLSLDPLELIGFSRAGALAPKQMLVYDKRSQGFWPGEGCGFAVLADYEFARANRLKILSVIKGWGISSDGKGGLTRPDEAGQCLALKRAYQKAGYGINTVAYIEGHGTGTAVGDAVELSAIINLLSADKPTAPVYIGSVKANIGHTKAAAGMAGLIKSILVIRNRLIPVATGNNEPHALFDKQDVLQLPGSNFPYQEKFPLRIGVSSMGFGGINTHVTIEEDQEFHHGSAHIYKTPFPAARQDSELFIIRDVNLEGLKRQLTALLQRANQLSMAELTDLSCSMYHFHLRPGTFRVAIEAATPDELAEKLDKLMGMIDEVNEIFDAESGIYYANCQRPMRIGLLFPGQGNDVFYPGGLVTNRFPFIGSLVPGILTKDIDKERLKQTDIAQPAIVATSVLANKFLQHFKVEASVAIGHSVGELAALYWGGILTEKDAVDLATFRGNLMHASSLVKGAMISVKLSGRDHLIIKICNELEISLACINAPLQVVLSGKVSAVEEAMMMLKQEGVACNRLNVANAFHSSLMHNIEGPFYEYVRTIAFSAARGKIYSTVTGALINGGEEAITNLYNQLTRPVLFNKAFISASENVDLWIEAGAGTTLTNIARGFSKSPIVPLDFSGRSVKGILGIAGALFVTGNPFDLELLFSNRFYRKLSFEEPFTFLSNPCEAVPELLLNAQPVSPTKAIDKTPAIQADGVSTLDIEACFRQELAAKLDLPVTSIDGSQKMLDDFHLNSLFVGQLLAEFANEHGLNCTDTPLEYSNGSVDEIVAMFKLLNCSQEPGSSQSATEKKGEPEGIAAWVHTFKMVEIQEPSDAGNVPAAFAGCGFRGNIPKCVKEMPGTNTTTVIDKICVCLNEVDEIRAINILVEATREIMASPSIKGALFIQTDSLSNGFVKTLFQENPWLNITVLTTSAADLTAGLIQKELARLKGFREISYKNGKTYTRQLEISNDHTTPGLLPNERDVILVTGGAKGITLECVRQLGMVCKCRFILVGRSDHNADDSLRINLQSLEASHVIFEYCQAEIGDPNEVCQLVGKLNDQGTIITGIIHSAGMNHPRKISELTEENIIACLRPKVFGLRNIMDAIDRQALKFCISFGSLIAESGMEGNADYSLANQWMANEMLRLSEQNTGTKFLNIEWSVWGGTGMGQKLGALERLRSKGIYPISLDRGIEMFIELLKSPPRSVNVIVSGRYGQLQTLKAKKINHTHSFRFIEEILVQYADIELIAECSLSEHTDPYITDHIIEGKMLFPGVFGMEAIAQAVRCLTTGEPGNMTFTNVQFLHPIVLEKDKKKKIRTVVLHQAPGVYAAVIREDGSSFKKDHFKATVILRQGEHAGRPGCPVNTAALAFDPSAHLYECLLPHKGVFKRVRSFSRLEAYGCSALARYDDGVKLFSDFLSRQLALPHPILNDSVLHALQVCVPDKLLLPVHIGKVVFVPGSAATEIIINATEREQTGNDYIYDINVYTSEGGLIQRWESVCFKALARKRQPALSIELVEVILQRKVEALAGRRGGASAFLDTPSPYQQIVKRTDGSPIDISHFITKSDSGPHTLLIRSENMIRCDIEKVVQKSGNTWFTLLGHEKNELIKYVCNETGEDLSSVATRVWCVTECARKAGLPYDSALVFDHADDKDTVYFGAGEYVIMTYKCRLTNNADPMVFAVLLKPAYEKAI
jgi:enediyne polyketide synthase